MVLEFKLFKVKIGRCNQQECMLTYEKGLDKTCIKYYDDEFGEVYFYDGDLFSTLKKIRAFLEENEYMLLCAGSMPNVYPSRMSRQMSNGRKAYVHKERTKPGKKDVIDIFMPVDSSQVGTIEEQEKFITNWKNHIEGK